MTKRWFPNLFLEEVEGFYGEKNFSVIFESTKICTDDGMRVPEDSKCVSW